MARVRRFCLRRFLRQCVSTVALTGFGVLPLAFIGLAPRPAIAADWIYTQVGVLEVSVSVDDLARFAEDGTVSPAMEVIAAEFDEQQLAMLQTILSRRVDVDRPTELVQFTYSPMVESLLERLGRAFRTVEGRNGKAAIRNAIILAASDEDGFSLINILRKFPGEVVQVDLPTLIRFTTELAVQVDYRNAVIEAIAQEATRESTPDPTPLFSDTDEDDTPEPDWREPGEYTVEQDTVIVPVRAVRPTEIGFVSAYDFAVDLYWPAERDTPAPILLMTHGFGATRANYAYLAEHWASHGFVVVAPEHAGSDLTYRQVFLEGELNDILSPMEYLSRALDLTYTLDYLEELAEQNDAWAARLNLEQVGVFGNSLGGTTALAVAGATIDDDWLLAECTDNSASLNLAYVLQCPAKHLPPVNYDLTDPRIKAVIAAYPMTHFLYGPEGISTIGIPTLIYSGSNDIIAPAIPEQIHPFIWLNSSVNRGDTYLALVQGGTHFTTSDDAYIEGFPQFLRPPSTEIGRDYLNALSVTFFKRYLENDTDTAPLLSPDYAQTLSQEAMPLYLIESLTADDLAAAYGRTPPEPVVPSPAPPSPSPPFTSALDEIRETGTLRVGIRADAAPFGFLDGEGTWTGYCFDLVDELGQELERSLQLDTDLDIVRLPSNLENRFALVQNGTVHLECGPNTIRRDIDGVLFSYPFFYTGTQLLARSADAVIADPSRTLAGRAIGLLPNTTNAAFIEATYPFADPVYFEGMTGRTDAIAALTNGAIDAFASDGALILGELLRLNANPDDYVLLPGTPLTCDGYGLVLPEGDRLWQNTISTFLRSPKSRDIQSAWFSDILPDALTALEYCLSTAEP